MSGRKEGSTTKGNGSRLAATSASGAASPDHSQPSTKTMGGNQKLPSSSREMRNLAEKMRRDKLNTYVNELATLVPMGAGASKRIDKTSVLRLAANYIRIQNILKEEDEQTEKVQQHLGGDITHNLASAVGGFLLVVTSTGKVVYVTEAVDQFFGHSQVDLLGHTIFNVIHPDDHEIFQQQLNPRDKTRRSFFCRMMEKAITRNDPGRYEIIHVVGQLRTIPEAALNTATFCCTPSPSSINTSSDQDEDEDSDMDERQSVKATTNRIGTHMLVSFVRVVKDRPITELSLVESTQDEYITRHGMDGKILYTDHRISFVTGLMPTEVIGTSAFTYMHPDDMVWSIVAQKLMFVSTQGQGTVSYRLRCRDGSHVTLRSRGYLEVNKQTGQVESFICINTVLSITDAANEIKKQRKKLLPIVTSQDCDNHVASISSSLPPELLSALKKMMSPTALTEMVESFDANLGNVEKESSETSELESYAYQEKYNEPLILERKENTDPFKKHAKRLRTRKGDGSTEQNYWSGTDSWAKNRNKDMKEEEWLSSVSCGTAVGVNNNSVSECDVSPQPQHNICQYQQCQISAYLGPSTSPHCQEDKQFSSSSLPSPSIAQEEVSARSPLISSPQEGTSWTTVSPVSQYTNYAATPEAVCNQNPDLMTSPGMCSQNNIIEEVLSDTFNLGNSSACYPSPQDNSQSIRGNVAQTNYLKPEACVENISGNLIVEDFISQSTSNTASQNASMQRVSNVTGNTGEHSLSMMQYPAHHQNRPRRKNNGHVIASSRAIQLTVNYTDCTSNQRLLAQDQLLPQCSGPLQAVPQPELNPHQSSLAVNCYAQSPVMMKPGVTSAPSANLQPHLQRHQLISNKIQNFDFTPGECSYGQTLVGVTAHPPAAAAAAAPSWGSGATSCQQVGDSQLQGHLITKDLNQRTVSDSRQVRHCPSQQMQNEGGLP